MRLLIATVGAVFALPACTGPDSTRRTTLTGACFELEVDGVETMWFPEFALPPLIVLDSVPDVADWHRISEVPGSLPSVHRHARWRRLPDGTLHLIWSTGFTGWSVRFAAGGDTLRGIAEGIDDAPSGDPVRFPATAARIDCAAEVPPLHRRRRPAPEVPLKGGSMPLRLGAPLDWPSTVIDSSKGFHRITEAAAAPFDSADSVVVHVEGGRIVEIRIAYATSARAASAIEHLGSVYGPSEQWIDREIWIDLVDVRTALILRIADPRSMW